MEMQLGGLAATLRGGEVGERKMENHLWEYNMGMTHIYDI